MIRQAIGALLLFSIAGSTSGLSARATETNVNRSASIVHRISSANERQQMVVNTSRILTLERKIPRLLVNNPEVVRATPISPNQVQLSAMQAGVTQLNVWDEHQQLYTVDVVVTPDGRQLQMIIQAEFPDVKMGSYPRMGETAVMTELVLRSSDEALLEQAAGRVREMVAEAHRAAGLPVDNEPY